MSGRTTRYCRASAGTHARDGEPINPDMVAVLPPELDTSAFRSRRLTTALLEDAPLSAAKAYVTSRFAGFLMADGQEEEALLVGAAALEMTDQLGLDDLSANTLASIGVARAAQSASAGNTGSATSTFTIEARAPTPVMVSGDNAASGVKGFTLAFVNSYGCKASWFGAYDPRTAWQKDEITKIRNAGGTRFPSNTRTPTANAMSVAAGIAQPRASAPGPPVTPR